ncbi:MAG: L-2-amino-thiazoline-4-carboxylic acid hydrolase [Planctomycetota bacterium]|jgi:hypothetical protein|nr:L-2-amino-thiazoline-4-carboxylic acid hydrolase [Planctomycetota bacterium]MDP6989298.1 L-2-amino-thiazoline-4-carboxylic acid hydrolase [Planctomycetota bacterium]
MPNARCGPSSRWGPAWFELRHGLPIALGVLVRRFGILGALGVLARVARRRQRADPVAGAPPGRLGAAQERASLSQLRGLFCLDDVLSEEMDLPLAERLEVLGAIVAQAGARFIALGAAIPIRGWLGASADGRERQARRALDHFPNARCELRHVAPDALHFDVVYCRLAEVCRAMRREHLAALYCRADAVYFDGREGRPALERAETIAAGDARCSFRLRLGSPGSERKPTDSP